MLHGIWLGAFTADYDMISDILKDQPEMINEKSRRVDNKTPLMLACQAGDPKCIELLLNKGAELDAADVFGRTALMLASKYDFPNVVTLLLNRDSTLMHAVSENNMDALMYATDSGAMRAVVSRCSLLAKLLVWCSATLFLSFLTHSPSVCSRFSLLRGLFFFFPLYLNVYNILNV